MRRDIGMNTLLFFIAAFVIMLISTGCGEAKKEAGIPGTIVPTQQAATVGLDVCTTCHFGQVTTWKGSIHSNLADVNNLNDPGSPSYADFPDATCLTCHDQLGDGRRLTAGWTGDVDRPVVGCESCHGGGEQHWGLGPVPFPRSDASMCDNCHNASLPSFHIAGFGKPENGRIGEDYAASGHPKSINTHVYTTGSTTTVRALCSRCHSHEGVKQYISIVNGTDDYATINAAMAGKADVQNASKVDCKTCHVKAGHGPTMLLGQIANAGAFPAGASTEFMTCTSCHQLLKADGTQLDTSYHTPYDKTGTAVNVYGSPEEIIADTHYDDPLTGANIEGYVVNPAGTHDPSPGNTNRGICRDCHNQHNANNAINRQWASSAHGGEILEAKEGAANVYTAAVGAGGDAWQHYNWDDRAGRGSCQVCHTSTGIANFLNNPAGYDLSGAGNDFSHLSGWTPAGSSGQNEMLYCWGCHTDNVGGLRNPGPIPIVYTYTPTSAGGFPTTTVNVTLPEVGETNVCVKCHGGRGNNDTILANVQDADFSLVDTVNRSTRAAEHHAPTGASLYAQVLHSGYEYSGQNYTGAPAHAGIDVGASGRGPCVNCHLGGSTEPAASQKNHTFKATEHDIAGNITTIVHQTTCNTAACHNGGMSVASLEGKKDGFADAKAVLSALMSNSVTNYLNLNISTTSNNNYKTVAVNAYGALMNQLYLGEDPCAYVHNNLYARRLLFDSIDWMQDGDLDGTIDISGFATGATAAAFLKSGDPTTAVTRP